jgi:hypothetical protein
MTTINTFRDTIQALLEGKKIQRESWSDGEFIYIDEGGLLVDENGNREYIELLIDGCYKIHEEPEEDLKIENLKVGDIIKSNDGFSPVMILGISGKVVHVSYSGDFNRYCNTYSITDLAGMGYKLKKE